MKKSNIFSLFKTKPVIYYVMELNKCLCKITIEKPSNNVIIEAYDKENIFYPFKFRRNITLEDVEDFLESRCFPKERFNCKELLKQLDIPFYSYELIIEKTHGLMYDDYIWIKREGENIDYEDIKIR